jgi:hypothetical protein
MKTPKPENLAKLTSEQRRIYDAWEAEALISDDLVEKALTALAVGDQITAKAYFHQIEQTIPTICEHGKSIWDDCSACDDIERTLFPEDFDKDGMRLTEEEIIYDPNLN